jgi:AcrR family transcriptional regulator
MGTRPYVSKVRAAAAAETRQRLIDAALRFFREEQNVASFSLDAVAKAAGVSRLTVYNQFGSRRGLLEAVFDRFAEHGGLGDLPSAMTRSDPREGLDEVVAIFCRFWSSDEAVPRLHDAMAADPELDQALSQRNERRRAMIRMLVDRIAPAPRAAKAAKRDAIDLIFGLTSLGMFRSLRTTRSKQSICELVLTACHDALARLEAPRGR